MFKDAPGAVAFGAYVPSHRSIKCKLYHCLIPNSAASLSAISPTMLLISPSISPSIPWIVAFALETMLLKKEPIEVAVGVAPDVVVGVVVLGMRLCPRVEVLSLRYCQMEILRGSRRLTVTI